MGRLKNGELKKRDITVTGREIVTKIIRQTLLNFEENKIHYAVLRNYENGFKDLPKDLDLIIDAKHENRIISIINDVCEDHILLRHQKKDHKRTVVSVLLKNEDPNVQGEVLFSFDLNKYLTLKKSKTHIKYKGFGSKITIKELTIQEKSFDQNDFIFKILAPEQELILLMTHLLGKKKYEYLGKINSTLAKLGNTPIGDIRNNLEILSKIQNVLLTSGIKKSNQLLKNILISFEFLKYKLSSFLSSRVIYFSGPDGSGKSTSYLWTLEFMKKLKVKYYPLRGLQVGIMFFLFFRSLLTKSGKRHNNILNNVGRLGYSNLKRDRNTGEIGWALRRRIGLFTGLLEICILGRLLIFLKKITGHVILVEESPVDIFVKRHRPRVKLLENLFMPLLPLPTASILCVANEEIIFKRKPELKKQEIEEYYQRINQLYSRNSRLFKRDLFTDAPLNETKSALASILNDVL